MHSQINVTYTNPRLFDGDPYEVAKRAMEQAAEMVDLAKTAVEDANILARNAELERRLPDGREAMRASATGWEQGGLGELLAVAAENLGGLAGKLRVPWARAAAYDPNHPPKE